MTYPVYCFWVGKIVTQVPGGGLLKLTVMLLLTGDFTVRMSGSSEIGGGNWAMVWGRLRRLQRKGPIKNFR